MKPDHHHRRRRRPPPPTSYLLAVPQLLLLLVSAASTTKFDFSTLSLSALKLLGDAHIKNGTIHLSRDLPVPNSGAGRALYADPIRLRHPTTRLALPFSTSFSFSVLNLNPSSIGGGLAFLLSSSLSSIGDAGGFLGLVNATAPTAANVVGVEFDTLMDVQFLDINGNHVGVDLNSLVSAEVADLDGVDVDLKSGDLVNAWIDYSGGEDGVIRVFVSYSTARPAEPVLSFPVDLSQFIDDEMYVGFSGSTQGSTEIHTIEWWSFSAPSSASPAAPISTSSPPPPTPPMVFPGSNSSTSPPTPLAPSSSVIAESPSIASSHSSSCKSNRLCRQGPAAVAGVATGGVVFIAACAGLIIWGVAAKRGKTIWNDILPTTAEIVKSPREFSYKELSAATKGFDASRIIGHGAFGTVYRGIVPSTGAMIAVKRCIQSGGGAAHDLRQGRAEFLSELSIIASLRHRHLVRLQGWCSEKAEILLVYDYMVHGSLDKALFDPSPSSSPAIQWRDRKKILIGVASALAYLHHECERRVIHRDVKSSNVMLDAGYHARLGDFGLARQVEHDKSPDATVAAGTMGYLAPEYMLTGRASEKTDVFSFGAVVLEVVSGRRAIENLVAWVWGLHGEGRLGEAIDERLEVGFDEGEVRRTVMVGLACSSPDPAVRPGMRAVVQMLSGEAEVPAVPARRPSMSFSGAASTQHLLMSLQDSVSDYNAMGLDLSYSSSSSSSLTTALRGGGGE